MFRQFTINAGSPVEFYEPGDFFRLMTASSPVDVFYYWQGMEVARAESVGGGYAERFDAGRKFDRVKIASAATQTIQFASRDGNTVFYDLPPLGNVNGSFGTTQVTVTNTSTQIDTANLFRRYLLIQNKDASGSIYIRFGATAATTANAIRIGPGGSYEVNGFAPTDAIQAIGDIASNANVVMVEG